MSVIADIRRTFKIARTGVSRKSSQKFMSIFEGDGDNEKAQSRQITSLSSYLSTHFDWRRHRLKAKAFHRLS